jgi:peptide/nickel transport system permease protein
MTDFAQARAVRKRKPQWLVFVSRLVHEKPLGTVGAVITVLLLLTGIFANFIAPYGYNQVDMHNSLARPSAQHLLGTDNLGRDVLSRVIFGARISVIVGLAAPVLATILSLLIGLIGGYFGGRFDLWIQRFVDVVMCVPPLILLMIVIAIMGPGMWQVIVALALRWGIVGSRIIRSSVISIKENVYVKAARAMGCSTTRIIARHLLPNIMAPTIVLFTTRVPNVILVEASLSFLGFGLPPPLPSWGGMLSGSSRIYMLQAPWMAIWPGVAIALVVYGVNIFGDALRDLLDPKMKGGAGQYGVKDSIRARRIRDFLKMPGGSSEGK